MSERTPSAHSMTVEPETERENLAAKLFKLEQWKAEAVVTIDRIMLERDDARHELASLSTTWTAVRVKELEKQQAEDTAACNAIAGERDEARDALEKARAEIARLGDNLDALRAVRIGLESERDELKARNAALLKAYGEYSDRGRQLRTMCHALVDAV